MSRRSQTAAAALCVRGAVAASLLTMLALAAILASQPMLLQ